MTTGYNAALNLNGDLARPQTECGQPTLMPGDIILFECGSGWFGRLERWALESEWGHAVVKGRGPLIIESIGRGVLRRNIDTQTGRRVKILRHVNSTVARQAVIRAEEIANQPQAYYDYIGLVRWLIPHLLWYKLTGIAWHTAYKHDSRYWCSEAVSAFYGDKLGLEEYEPLAPGDLDKSPYLNVVFEGVL
jgi:uncharacterized protein YycO